ncbi:MAG: SDR family oxidoreductase [Elusimicrobia bacterium]|nr:SDR family oxidoreductase [Elusimicrobiota bacterium]
MNRLKDKVVLVTGASSGIGWATAVELAKHGARLALAARRADKLSELSKLLKTETFLVPCDVTDFKQGRQAIKAVVKTFGRLDILINNAGLMATARYHEQDFHEVERVLRTNYLGAAVLIHEALPVMLKQKEGHIVNVASIAGLLGMPYMAAYAASKFALVGLTDSLRREYYRTGVTLTVVCPGSVDTPMAVENLNDEGLSRLARPKTAEQMAHKIAHCCVNRHPRLIYGDVPGAMIHFAHWAPRLTDWILHHTYGKAHPLGRSRGNP